MIYLSVIYDIERENKEDRQRLEELFDELAPKLNAKLNATLSGDDVHTVWYWLDDNSKDGPVGELTALWEKEIEGLSPVSRNAKITSLFREGNGSGSDSDMTARQSGKEANIGYCADS